MTASTLIQIAAIEHLNERRREAERSRLAAGQRPAGRPRRSIRRLHPRRDPRAAVA